MQRPGIGLLAMAAAFLPAMDAGQDAADALAALSAQDARLARIGHRLAVANRSLCASRAPIAGWALHALAQYRPAYRAAARARWGLDERPAVAAVVAGGAAERAGVRPGDRVLTIDGARFATAPLAATPSYAPVEAALREVERALTDGVAQLDLDRDGTRMRVTMRGDPACASRFEVSAGDDAQARADGTYVQVESGLLAAMPDDDEAAAAVAHELAHNLLCHRARLQAQGIDPSRRRQSRAARTAIRITEAQADLLSVTLLANAGYDPAAAPRLWARLGRERRRASGSHPPPEDRVALLTREAQRIAALRASGRAIAPPSAAMPSASPCAVSISQR